MVTPGPRSLDPSKLIDLIILRSLWVHEALGDLLISIVSNAHFGKQPRAPDITIFSLHCLPHVTKNVFSYL